MTLTDEVFAAWSSQVLIRRQDWNPASGARNLAPIPPEFEVRITLGRCYYPMVLYEDDRQQVSRYQGRQSCCPQTMQAVGPPRPHTVIQIDYEKQPPCAYIDMALKSMHSNSSTIGRLRRDTFSRPGPGRLPTHATLKVVCGT